MPRAAPVINAVWPDNDCDGMPSLLIKPVLTVNMMSFRERLSSWVVAKVPIFLRQDADSYEMALGRMSKCWPDLFP